MQYAVQVTTVRSCGRCEQDFQDGVATVHRLTAVSPLVEHNDSPQQRTVYKTEGLKKEINEFG